MQSQQYIEKLDDRNYTMCSSIWAKVGIDYALSSLSDQARRLAPGTSHYVIGGSPG